MTKERLGDWYTCILFPGSSPRWHDERIWKQSWHKFWNRVTWADSVKAVMGYSSFPEVVSCKSCLGSESSNGKRPHTMVYRTTPRLHTSLAMPSYGIPERQDTRMRSWYTMESVVYRWRDFFLFYVSEYLKLDHSQRSMSMSKRKILLCSGFRLEVHDLSVDVI